MEGYNAAGVVISIVGAAVAAYSYFVALSVPLTALGVGMLVVGASIAITPAKPVPGRAIKMLLESSVANTEALLEEVGATGKAFYVPVKGGVYAYVPLESASSSPPRPTEAPKGLVTEHGGVRYLVLMPPLPRLGEASNLEEAVTEVLVDLTELCDSVKVARGEGLVVELKNPRARVGAGRFRSVMGSLEACAVATVVASVLNRVVVVEAEADHGNRRIVKLKVL